ncbi:hypothetical protein [Aneurinibacillus aneurinilyticus]|jgi:hypothetical protein|uniref:hypothetical protein n=1 Tax=Aneurinibacillus aneurinilyticus TaxID=1391 RepID=UPI0023F3F463|nr:hypothetical protein [Aneurinibacillus aneurinilyticus]MCI1696035.1 hypothetical protein [Aneurinibacillus aneurinilyticus]
MNKSLKKYVASISLLGLMAAPITFSSVFATEITTKNVEDISVEKNNLGQEKLTQEQKKAYYKQYVKIIEEVVAEHEGTNMWVAPFDEFTEEDWVEPEEFRQKAIARANLRFENFQLSNSSGPVALGAVTKTKETQIHAEGVTVGLYVTGSFKTEYNHTAKRQFFKTINSVTSRTSKGTWKQTGYTPRLIDGGRTFEISIGGELKLDGIYSTHRASLEFHCDAYGGIS